MKFFKQVLIPEPTDGKFESNSTDKNISNPSNVPKHKCANLEIDVTIKGSNSRHRTASVCLNTYRLDSRV